MHVQRVVEDNRVIEFQPDILSIHSQTSGTVSYESLRGPNLQDRVCEKQESVVQYYKKATIEEEVNTRGGEPLRPFFLDEVGLQETAKELSTNSEPLRLLVRRGYRSQEYKRTAFRIIDEYFRHPEGQIFRLSGETRQGSITAQLCGVDQLQGRLDEDELAKRLRTETVVDELAVRRRRIDAIKHNHP